MSRRAAARLAAAAAALLALAACRIEVGPPEAARDCADDDAPPSGRVVVYTSLYREVVDELRALAREKLPGVDVEFFQGGSEKVATRLDADLAAGRAGADVLLISDPFTYARLKAQGELLPFVSPHATPIPRSLVDVDNFFVAARLSTMVLAHHADRPGDPPPPRSFAALAAPEAAKDAAFGDPLSSGTYFATVAVLSGGDEPRFLGALREGGAALGGGNSVVLSRILSGERAFGPVLLENVLSAKRKGEPVGFVLPEDGAVVVPGHAAILADTRDARAARAFVDLVLSPEGQRLMAEKGDMHAADPRVPPPAGAPPLYDLLERARVPSPALVERLVRERGRFVESIEQSLSP